MGIGAIVSIMAANNAMAASRSVIGGGGSHPQNGGPSKYGEKFREQIIRKAIRASRPHWWGIEGFNICPVNDACDVLNPQYPRNDAYNLLHVYHCVWYWNIPREIRKRIPELVREALTPEMQ